MSATVIVGSANIARARMLTLKAMLKLEVKGMRRSRGPSAYLICKQEFGLRGTKAQVLEQMEKLPA